jgi:protein NirF
MKSLISALAVAASMGTAAFAETIATGDLGLIIERAKGSVLLVDQSERASLARIEGLGDLSHASMV